MINNVNSSTLSAVLDTSRTSSTAKTPSSIPPAAGAASSTHISKPGQLLQQLQQLQQQDPTKFKQVVTQLADSVQQIADNSGDTQGLAAKFATALKSVADTGDLSALQTAMQPPKLTQAQISEMKTSQNGTTTGAQTYPHHSGGGALHSAIDTAMNQVTQALQASSAPVQGTSSST
jgi:hypothetical protein